MGAVDLRIYATCPADPEAAFNERAQATYDALTTGKPVANLPATVDGWIEHINAFTADCRVNNKLVGTDPRTVATANFFYGDHLSFGRGLLMIGAKVALDHQAEIAGRSEVEVDRLHALAAAMETADNTFAAFGHVRYH